MQNRLSSSQATRRYVIEALAVLGILALAAFLRLARVGDNPGWFSDEGTAINIAQNLMQGKVQYLAINQSTLLEAKLPLFSLILAGLFKVWGAGIVTLRTFTGILGVLSVGLLYGVLRVMRKEGGEALALLSAFLLAIYPKAILYNRLGYSYNLVTPLILLTFGGLWQYLGTRKNGWLAFAALALGIAAAGDLVAVSVVPVFILIVSARSWRALLWSLPLIALPFAIYAAVMLVTAPQAFTFDLVFTLTRVGGVPLIAQFPMAAVNFAAVADFDGWFLPAIIGMFLIRSRRLKRLVLLFYLLTFVMVGGKVVLPGIGYYYISPFLPFIAIGIASLILYVTPRLVAFVRAGLTDLYRQWGWVPVKKPGVQLTSGVTTLLTMLALFMMVISPVLFTIYQMTRQVYEGFDTAIAPLLIDPGGARQVADFVNQSVQPTDLVIASPAIAWMFHANVTDFQQVVAAKGIATIHFPDNIPPDRFAFPVDEKGARYVVFDRIWYNWAALNMPAVKELMDEIEQWPAVLKIGEYTVYANPALGAHE
jgi:4-amino-4-deoxy-L-arabinose transferase-like glycosyltransferase